MRAPLLPVVSIAALRKSTRSCLFVGAPGFDPGRLQQSAAPVYKTEPHASADAVLVGVAGFEPATSSFRTMAGQVGLEPTSVV